ncbi:MAG: hypothetical protein HGA19_21175 [Oscillochloris sp.]|nr:hypothetical protein [Oscillochloris sp.]
MSDTVTLTFGYEEVLLLTRLLKIPALPGMAEDLLAHTPDAQLTAALGSAERSLQARGMVKINTADTPVAIYRPILALFSSCAHAQAIATVMVKATGQPLQVRFYHIAEHLSVERSFPRAGLHTFTGAVSSQVFAEQLGTFLKLGKQPLASDISVTLARSVYEQAQQRPSVEAAAQALVAGGVAQDIAQILAADMQQSRCDVVFRVAYRDQRIAAQALALKVTESTVWLTRPGTGEDQLAMQLVSGPAALDQVLTLLRRDYVNAA